MNHMFHGFDMDRTMLRIGAMNMMTHGIDNLHRIPGQPQRPEPGPGEVHPDPGQSPFKGVWTRTSCPPTC